MPLQQPCGLWIDGHGDVGERIVDEHDLRVGAGHGLDCNAVVLLLVDQLDAVRHVGLRIAEVRRIVNQNRPIADKVAGWPKGAGDLVGRPVKNLVFRTKHGQAFRIPRINHLIHGVQCILGGLRRRLFTFSQLANEPKCSFDLVEGGCHLRS